jgi:hypothetical protein
MIILRCAVYDKFLLNCFFIMQTARYRLDHWKLDQRFVYQFFLSETVYKQVYPGSVKQFKKAEK